MLFRSPPSLRTEVEEVSAAALTLVSLPELRRLPEGKQWSVDQAISGLESLTPVRGVLQLARMLKAAQSTLAQDRAWLAETRKKLQDADVRLDAAFGRLLGRP